eukprot:Gb_33925 [translate_table: standard]
MARSCSFKDIHTFEERKAEAEAICERYPDRVPVIVERVSKTDLPEMDKKKYLVPRDSTVGQFIHILSSRLHVSPGRALFVSVADILPQTASLMGSTYEKYKDEDGFLYMFYSGEKTFGSLEPQGETTIRGSK